MKALLRYAVVGAANNAFWFGIYLLGTYLGVEPLTMATLGYVAGVATSYAVNRGWSFSSKRAHSGGVPRYIVAYAIGYLTNMAILYVLYVRGGIPHQYAQLASAAIVAVELFLILRLWVFPSNARARGAPTG
jgi:putative flippase GtrA